MKKIGVFLAIAFFVYAFAVMGRAWLTRPISAQAAQVQAINTPYPTPTYIPTSTPIPTATIGYEATVYVAQATADEARRVNAVVTAEHEALILSILQLTAESEKRGQEVLSWTQLAAPTIIPLTATQQVAMNTQIANAQVLQSSQLTATYQAPTQLAAIAQIQDIQQYATVDRFIRVAFVFVIGGFLIAVIWFIFRYAPTAPQLTQTQTETVVQMRRKTGTGTFQQTRVVVPCSSEQLTELAELAANGEKRFGINRLETSSRTFKGQRGTLIEVREFLVANGLAIKTDDGLVTLNDGGEEFLAGWFDLHRLPDQYEFGNMPEAVLG